MTNSRLILLAFPTFWRLPGRESETIAEKATQESSIVLTVHIAVGIEVFVESALTGELVQRQPEPSMVLAVDGEME